MEINIKTEKYKFQFISQTDAYTYTFDKRDHSLLCNVSFYLCRTYLVKILAMITAKNIAVIPAVLLHKISIHKDLDIPLNTVRFDI